MAIGGLLVAALCAGALGWIGRPVLVLLPDVEEAGPQTPSFRDISRAPQLGWWFAGTSAALIVIVAMSVPLFVLPAWVLVCGMGTWLAYLEWRTRLLSLPLAALLWAATFLVVLLEAWLASDLGILLLSLAISAGSTGLLWLIWQVGAQVRPGVVGIGDVRFAAPVGLALGSVGLVPALAGVGLGLVLALVVGISRRVGERAADFAVGPALLVGAVLGLVLT